mmetsp:Transcript_41317/g.50091  ORF Transcript_41317/g.50091 Transcript_41317/m.50091 type:complete len:368 (-) Transcript_41317:79-1182(-)
MAFAAVIPMFIFFVFGFPVVLVLWMRYLKKFKRVFIELTDVSTPTLQNYLLTNKWKIANDKDQAYLDEILQGNTGIQYPYLSTRAVRPVNWDNMVEMFIHKDTFTELKLDPSDYEVMKEGFLEWKVEHSDVKEDLTRLVRVDLERTDGGTKRLGQVSMIMFERIDQGDDGAQTIVSQTQLHCEPYDSAFGWLYRDYEDRHYYWQCYDIARRLVQTGGVLVVGSQFGKNVGLGFAQLVAFVAYSIHEQNTPYHCDWLDRLTRVVLMNQVIVQFVLIFMGFADEKGKQTLGWLLLIMQIFVVVYAGRVLSFTLVPVIRQIRYRTKVIKRTLKERHQRKNRSQKEQRTDRAVDEDDIDPQADIVFRPNTR